MKICIVVSFTFLFHCSLKSHAQNVAGLPVQFIQFFKTYTLINPASIGIDSSVEFSTGNKSLTGAFSGVRTFYANGNIRLGSANSRGVKHVIGLTFIDDQEGTYINRTKASFMYALHVPLSSRLTFNAGLAAGFLNYSFGASNISAGGSAFAPNADIGLWLHRSDFNLGISGNQVIPSKLTPIDQTYIIDRHYNIIGEKTFQINPYLSLKPAFVLRWLNQNTYNVDFALIALIQNNLLVAVAYKYTQGASLSGGLNNIRINQHILKMMISYYTPIGGVAYYNPPSYEISLNFIPSKSRKIEEEE